MDEECNYCDCFDASVTLEGGKYICDSCASARRRCLDCGTFTKKECSGCGKPFCEAHLDISDECDSCDDGDE